MKHQKTIVIILLCLLWIIAGILLVRNHSGNANVEPDTESAIQNTPAPAPQIEFGQTKFNPANYKQNNRYYGVFNGKLYTRHDKYTVLCYTEREFCEFKKFDDSTIAIGFHDDFLYYMCNNGPGSESEASYTYYALNLNNGTTSELGKYDPGNKKPYAWDGKLYVHMGGRFPEPEYLVISKNAEPELITQAESYLMNGYRYQLDDSQIRQMLVRYDEAGNREEYTDQMFDPEAYMLPCENGLLIYNGGTGNLLFFVERETGKLVPLFSMEVYHGVFGTVTVHENYAYLSHYRYKERGEKTGIIVEDDPMNGTFKVSLDDYSIEKISDMYFDALFTFDDTGIFATGWKYGNKLIKLDFDGNVIFEVKQGS